MLPLDAEMACPAATPDSLVQVEVVAAGLFHTSWSDIEGAGRRGKATLPLNVGVIRHPLGTVLVDSGLGQTTRDRTFPRFPLSLLDVEVPAGSSAREHAGNVLRVLLTHGHYDHIGGLFDLPNVEVWTQPADIYSGWFPADLIQLVHFVTPNLGSRVLGRPAVDVLGDGTIWYISTPGHTLGAASVLVRAQDTQWLFVGDTAWVETHLHDLRRPETISAMFDSDRAQLDQSLDWSRWFVANCPGLNVVAGHEARWTTPAISTAGAANP